jgi:hypothetical protein
MQGSRIEGNTLYPHFYNPPDQSKFQGKNFVSCILDNVRSTLEEKVSRK